MPNDPEMVSSLTMKTFLNIPFGVQHRNRDNAKTPFGIPLKQYRGLKNGHCVYGVFGHIVLLHCDAKCMKTSTVFININK